MARFQAYEGQFRNVALTRSDGILEMRLHSAGGQARWGVREDSLHAEIGEAFHAIAHDPDNRVVILTGTGGVFLTEMHPEERPSALDPRFWDRMQVEGRDILMNLLDIPVPVIAAVNGPAAIRSEIPALCDIVLAAEHASFSDAGHFPSGAVPGDGAHVAWTELLGPNRGRYFLLTGQVLDAAEALRLGVVAEVLPAEGLMARARALAALLARQSDLTLRYTRQVLVQRLRRRMLEELGPGLMYEGAALMDAAWPRPPAAAPAPSGEG